ncbi:histidinol-phosphatase HisJ family protein [Peribacillus sp. SCS-26]|uniref:histidinol-phosphatase HisJ family protein n=1 Tax=Paraperibacillus marinus TaxID=3115295 RepID=UPI003906CD50
MFDYHVHTEFSADSKMPMETACKTALEQGITEIAFTEHVDYFYPGSELVWEFDYCSYAQKIDALRKEYEGRLTILKAVEMGLHPSSFAQSKDFTDTNEFDFIIGSVHIAGGLDLHNGDFFKGKTLHESLEAYFEDMNAYVKEYQDFNILGHLTLIKRYLHFVDAGWRDIKWHSYFDIIEDTFKHLIHTGRGIEINLSGFRYRIDVPLPNLPFVQLYKQTGGEIITVGTDAHSKHFIGRHMEEAYSILKTAGFQYIASYRERKPVFHRLDTVI